MTVVSLLCVAGLWWFIGQKTSTFRPVVSEAFSWYSVAGSIARFTMPVRGFFISCHVDSVLISRNSCKMRPLLLLNVRNCTFHSLI